MTCLGCFELQIGMYFSVEIAQAMDEKDGGGSGKVRTKDYFDYRTLRILAQSSPRALHRESLVRIAPASERATSTECVFMERF